MNTFRFEVAGEGEETLSGTIVAISEYVARRRLQDQYGKVLSLVEVEQPRQNLPTGARVPRVALALYTRQLAVLLKSGVSLPRALEILAQGDCQDLNEVFMVVRGEVERGRSLSRAMKRFPAAFDELYVTMIQASELSGNLGSLDKLAQVLEDVTRLQKRIVATLTYPLFVAVISMLVLGLFVVLVMPGMEPSFTSIGAKLPLITRVILAVTHFLTNPLLVLAALAGLGTAGWAAGRRLRTVEGRRALDARLRSLPVVGAMLKTRDGARVLYLLASLLDCGIMLDTALDVAGRAAGSRAVEMGLYHVRRTLREGRTLAESLGSSDLFPPAVRQMLATGEEAGRLGTMMLCACGMLERDLERFLDSVASILEPLVLVVVGSIVALITAAAFLPNIALLDAL